MTGCPYPIPLYASGSLVLLFGLVNCFWGYRIFRVLIGFWGCLAGLYGGLSVSQYYLGFTGLGKWIIAAMSGVLGIVLVSVLYYVGVFLIGAVLGYVVMDLIALRLAVSPHLVWFALALTAGGALALVLQKPVIIFATSYIGAYTVVGAVLCLMTGDPIWTPTRFFEVKPPVMIFALTGWLVLGTLGAAVQMGLTGKVETRRSK